MGVGRQGVVHRGVGGAAGREGTLRRRVHRRVPPGTCGVKVLPMREEEALGVLDRKSKQLWARTENDEQLQLETGWNPKSVC